jgi:hypothetical protein
MRKPLLSLVTIVVIAIAVYAVQAQQAPAQNAPAQNPPPGQAPGQQPGRGRAGGADPYANNANPGTLTFPLAAAAGKDSNAKNVAPMGAVNSGPFDPATWKYGTAFNAPPGSKIWNPAKVKLMQGGKLTGGTLFSATDPATY